MPAAMPPLTAPASARAQPAYGVSPRRSARHGWRWALVSLLVAALGLLLLGDVLAQVSTLRAVSHNATLAVLQDRDLDLPLSLELNTSVPSRVLGRDIPGSLPNVMLGLRLRVSREHALFANASAEQGLYADPTLAAYSGKVGLEWKPAKPQFGLEQGALGFQLASGYKLSLRARHGGPALYLRGKF